VVDLWGAGIDPQTFLEPILQRYAHKSLLRSARQQGFAIEAEEHLEDGTIRVVVGRWV
jgi:dihydroorotase